jgi:hypothetical protein
MGVIERKTNDRYIMGKELAKVTICERKSQKYKKWCRNYDKFDAERRTIYQGYLDTRKKFKKTMFYYSRKEIYEKIKLELFPAKKDKYNFNVSVSYWMSCQRKQVIGNG